MNLRLRTFHEVAGDRPIDRYTRRDLQDYVNRMQFWPANGTKRAEWSTLTTSQILELNGSLQERPIGRKTMEHGYVATIRAAMGRACDEHQIPNPFLQARIRWPDGLAPSIAREPISHDVLNRTFELGVASGYLDRAMLPLLACLTGRRIGLLCHLQGQDIRQKDGVWIARTAGIVKLSGGWKRVPYKTEPSTQFFVLPRFLAEIGFTDWASRRDAFVPAELQKLADPSRTASQALNRLLRKAGAAGDRREVFHSLRGDRIDENRDQVAERTNRLQVGHRLEGEHDRSYGQRSLRPAEMQQLYELPIPDTLDLTPFTALNFDALASRRRKARRRYC